MSNGATNDKDGPDFIGYYRHLFSTEISKIEDQPTSLNLDTFFINCLGGGISDHKKDKLRSILHEAAIALNKEADEIFEKIIAELKAESDPGQSSCFSGNSNKGSTQEASVSRKRKKPSVPDFSRENGFCSSQLAEKLCMMEEGIEKFINEVVVNCRAMTSAEKQQLGRKIQKLPEKAYDRLIEIFQSRNPFTRQNSDSVFINLEKQDDGTLWRLYYYVETVLRASKT